jgi:serine/threonine protein kinase
MPIAVGQVVNGRYQIIRLLGQGGFGAVYLAHDLSLNRPCALKENLETSDEVRRQFIREAQLLGNLNHPNLPRVIDYFVLAGHGQYLVMDYVEGEDLQELLDRTAQPLPEAQALDWIGQVCAALTYLHQHNPPVIHRDIKPSNIRITPSGQAMLVDFGIAKFYDGQSQTTAGARAFTPGYSPPEQYGKAPTDERSDIYALGATLYTLLTNQVPPDSVDLLTGSATPLTPAHLVNPKATPPVGRAIAQAMEPERSRRFHSVAEFHEALGAETTLSKTRVIEQPPARQNPSPGGRPILLQTQRLKPLKDWRRRRSSFSVYMATALGLMLVALLITLFGLWLVNNRGFTHADWGLTQPSSTPPALAVVQSFTPTPTNSPAHSPTPAPPPQPGAILVDLPAAKIAFASDHAGDGKDRIFVDEIQPGSTWLTPISGILYQLAASGSTSSGTAKPILGPLAVPIDEAQERAWWPEWCDGNRTLLFEGGDKESKSIQTIYIVNYTTPGLGEPKPIHWDGFVMLGVPRCSQRGDLVTATARQDLERNTWLLHQFRLDKPNYPLLVGDGYPAFGGNVSFSSDDRWSVLMHKEGEYDQVFQLITIQWDDPDHPVDVPTPASVYAAMYPSISPTTGEIAFACQLSPDTRREAGAWGLCIQEADGQNFRYLEQLGTTLGQRGFYNRFHVFTPSWSADGRWIAYASPKDGDWDIYLYNIQRNVEFNLTQLLGGDQFDPTWSKP